MCAVGPFTGFGRIMCIIPAMGSGYALAYGKKLAAQLGKDQHIVVNLSGRGDKDIFTIAQMEGISLL